ncbi:RING-H2 finger protein ATL80-like [Bidens hawaiensis]|uniref:RING-H2 finger protein ATL80-like n=1 Tax=Bidens hawaiensis TaxID=980011 RepID=UPI00404B657F
MPRRILAGDNSPPPEAENVDSDFVVILAALLCALICILGLIAVARCSWIRRISGIVSSGRTDQSPPAAANKGFKKKVLNTLPKLTYSPENVKVSDCAICLTDFAAGDEIRVLPKCGHSFHVICIDKWFGSHSSCPSCRQILSPAPRCKKCGEIPAAGVTPAAGDTSAAVDRFLP